MIQTLSYYTPKKLLTQKLNIIYGSTSNDDSSSYYLYLNIFWCKKFLGCKQAPFLDNWSKLRNFGKKFIVVEVIILM